MSLKKPVAITHNSGSNVVVLERVNTLAEAEAWISSQQLRDPIGVYRGDYGIDAPEEMVNG